MDHQTTPEEERLEAIKRLLQILEPAETPEALELVSGLLAMIIHGYQVEPGSDRWVQFFGGFISYTAEKVEGLKLYRTVH
jgi:hypothetical protein